MVGLFSPKSKFEAINSKYTVQSNSRFPVMPTPFKEAFKGEKISVIKLDGVISDSTTSSFFRDSTSSNSVLDLIIKATKDQSV